MASIVKKKIRGQTYYYAVESKRVNGKPRIVWQRYLGKVHDIVQALTARGDIPEIKSARVCDFGAEAALLAIAKRLGVAELIDKIVGWDGEGLSAGEYLILCAIYISTTPETKLPVWYERTMLKRCFNVGSRVLTEKKFWSFAELLTPASIEIIMKELARKIIDEFSLGPEALLYGGIRMPFVPEMGYKMSQAAVTHVSVLTTKEFNVPLFYKIHQSGFPDERAFEAMFGSLIEEYCSLGFPERDITIVNYFLDKPEEVVAGRPGQKKSTRVLGVFDGNENKELLNIPPERFHLLGPSHLGKKVKVFRVPKRLGEKNVVILAIHRERDFALQAEEIRADLLSEGSFNSDAAGRIFLGYKDDNDGVVKLRENLSERKLLITDNVHWGNHEIYSAFYGRRQLVIALDRMKIWPGPHSAPKSELRVVVNAFCQMLALTMQSLLRCELSRCGIAGSAPEIFKILSEIREVTVTYAKGGRSGKKQYLIAELDPLRKEIYDFLRLGQFEAVEGLKDLKDV